MTIAIATRAADGGIRLTVHDHGEVVAVALEPRRALPRASSRWSRRGCRFG
jgi:hypothetical protein